MPLQATSGAASYDAFGGGVPSEPNYIESVFSCFLYTGNGSTQTITNGIDLAGKGGLVWIKRRDGAGDHTLTDTLRGASNVLYSNATNAQSTDTQAGAYAYLSNGFDVYSASGLGTSNRSGATYASWTFRKQPKFFDVVTYTGDGTSGRTVAHNLGSVPGCIIVKQTNAAREWAVYHTSLGNTQYINLDSTGGAQTQTYWNNTSPTSTNFTVGDWGAVNQAGSTYVAYLFAHNAGGFGLTGTDNVISCGSFTTDGSGNATVDLGYEPQYLMWKASSQDGNWLVLDNMRGWTNGGNESLLRPNTSDAESTGGQYGHPTATGFYMQNMASSTTYIYIAIRRGPMKVPTSGTSVFSPNTTTNDTVISTTGFPVDLCIEDIRTPSSYPEAFDRLRGSGIRLLLTSTDAEGNTGTDSQFQSNTGVTPNRNGSGVSCILWNFRRAPSFFDEVCYTGNRASGASTTQTLTHNLGATPELMIVKGRSNADGWKVYSSTLGASSQLALSSTAASFSAANPNGMWNETAPTATQFTVGANNNVNRSGSTYVAYLFATCAGVSKVGSYTGTGATQTISCGFSGGARFVLVKRTDSTGDWYVWDTARGMVSGTDPRLTLNSVAAESNADWVYTTTGGFQIVTTDASVNASGGTYIFLAIA